MKKHLLSFLTLLPLLASAQDAISTAMDYPRRIAYVVTVGDYSQSRGFSEATGSTGPLKSFTAAAANDRSLMTTALRGLNFEVHAFPPDSSTPHPTFDTFREIRSQLAADLAQGPCVALFYFSGHGVMHKGINYLVPAGADVSLGSLLSTNAIPANSIGDVMRDANPKGVNLLFFDACRNELPRSIADKTSSAGNDDLFSEVKCAGVFVGFSTSAATKAFSSDKGSFLTRALADRLTKDAAKYSVSDLYSLVRRDVKAKAAASDLIQTPEASGAVDGIFYLARRSSQSEVPPVPVPSSDPLAGVSKLTPFTNSLGMKFVPAGTPGVLFSVWEARVKDFEAFVEETKHDAIGNSTFGAPAYTLEKTADGKGAEWAQKGGSWQNPHFPTQQTGEHPVVCVSYLDAEAFCAWLTKQDRAAGTIPQTASYRLPTDSEWSRAVGGSEFPWGESYPPGNEDGNYCGKEAMVGVYEGFSNELVKGGYKDSAARTAAVGMFKENRFGLYDMGGNVFEWCSTWYTADLNDAETKEAFPVLKDDKGGQTFRVLRGASWFIVVRVDLRSACRNFVDPRGRDDLYGFRVVLVVAGG
jgi:formylglycine-generating enzyme required for sulfatase activity